MTRSTRTLVACLFGALFATEGAGCASGEVIEDTGPRSEAGVDARPMDAAGDAGSVACTTAAECDDENACTGVETCVSGRCAPGTPVNCDDTLGCTTDACDPATAACSHTADDTRCSAGLVCDTTDGCTTPRACTTDDECDDGVFCNGTETCDAAFGCRRGTAPACDDGFGCTADACDAGTDACVSVAMNALCDDGAVCDGAETCAPTDPSADANGCLLGAPLACDDGVTCTLDACDEGAGGCTHTADASRCQDGVFCNGAEICDPALGCGPGMAPTCADTIDCTVGRCDAASDRCVQEANDAFCGDGLSCNGSERCDVTGTTPGRGCVAGAPLDCSDGIACTTDGCTEPGTCTHGGSDADGDGFTAVGCGAGNDCNDLVASVRPGAAELCDGIDNDCSGTIDDGAGLTCALGSAPRACTTSCGSPGLRACNAACGLGPCIGTAELCNDCDDDGNGSIDDGLTCRRGTSAACTTSCGTSGARTCASDCSGYGVCAAASETCNDCDDNGNGIVDDGLTCRRGTSAACTTTCGTAGSRVCALDCSGYGSCRAAAESCNACDDDGDGLLDEDFVCRQGQTQSCTTACGTAGIRTCAGDCSGFGACVATEVCNGCDDDADGTIDDGFTCTGGATTACTTGCGTSGTRTCNGTCSGFGACTASESCNGCDDDGDGTADEDFACRAGMTMGCTSACGTAGTRTCNASCSGFGSCSATEVCNGCDDDGNGTSDDGFACALGASTSCTTACGTTGTRSCNATCSGFGTCSATEVCNGCDDNGNGTADDGFACVGGSSMSCTTACGTTGTRACNGTCSGYGTCSATESCNGCDDNGNGTIDDGLACALGSSMACTTMCGTAGSRSCNGTCTGYGTCTAPTEVCGNGCDDNGNGTADEGCIVIPPNDQCSGAIALTGTTGTRSDTLVGATAQATGCGSGVDVFYSVTVTAPSIIYLSTLGATFDTAISYRGTTCAGTSVQCVDDSCGTLQSHLAQVVTAGTHYFAVHTWSTSTVPGAYTLTFDVMGAAGGTNTLATMGTAGSTSTFTGTTVGDANAATGTCSTTPSPEDSIYWLQCPADARSYAANTCSAATTFDTVIYARFRGNQIACNDDDSTCTTPSTLRSRITGAAASAAGVMQVFVDGYGSAGTTTGPYSVAITW